MLTVLYDADSGAVFPDNQVWDFVNKSVSNYLASPEAGSSTQKHVVTVGSITVFNAFRVAVKRGMVASSDVELRTETAHSYVDAHGQMEDPDVWNDIRLDEDLLNELLS